jgi:hypothetical protein
MALIRELLAAGINYDVVMEGLLDFRKGRIVDFRRKINLELGAAGVAAFDY